MMQRKSALCKACYSESKQYPISKAKHLSKDGYYYVYYKKHPYSDKSGRIYEHRLIMEKRLVDTFCHLRIYIIKMESEVIIE